MDEDLELFEQYQKEVEQLETLPPASVELPALQALAAVVLIQVMAARTTHPLLPMAVEAAEQLQSCFDQQSAIYKMLQMGWDKPPDLNNQAYKVLAAVAKGVPDGFPREEGEMTEEKELQKANEIFDKVKKALQHIEEEVVVYPDEDGVHVEKEGGEKGDELMTNNQ